MKKVLLGIGLVLLILLILGFIAPKQYVVERSIKIYAPKTEVYGYMQSLEKLHEWSSHLPSESPVELKYTGNSGTVGAFASWKGTNAMLEGKETIQKVVPFNRIETEIRKIKPWESLNHATISVRGRGDSCLVTWLYDGHSPFPFNIRHLFNDMDLVSGPSFEQSLERLKFKAESKHLENLHQLKLVDLPSTAYPMIESGIDNQEEVLDFVNDNKEIRRYIPDSILHSVRSVRLIYDGIEVDSVREVWTFLGNSSIQVPDNQRENIVGGRAYVGRYTGGYEGLTEARSSMLTYIKMQKESLQYPIEEIYQIGSWMEVDTSKWLTYMRFRVVKDE